MSRSIITYNNLFTGLSLSLDRCAQWRDNQPWIESQRCSTQARYLLLDMHGSAYMQAHHDRLRWLDGDEYRRWLSDQPVSLLGTDADGIAYFLVGVEQADLADQLLSLLGSRRVSLREAGLLLSSLEASLFAYAKGLLHWQRETRFCGYCGSTLQMMAAGHRLQCSNESCGRAHFPRTDAAIIVIVEYGDACLLGRQRHWPSGRYSALAGFVEPGESLEDAVRREVAEEAGVCVEEVYYHSSQPWPMPSSLMLGFIARASSPQIKQRDDELEDVRWFTAPQLMEGLANGSLDVPSPLSISYQLLAHWLRQQNGIELADLLASTLG